MARRQTMPRINVENNQQQGGGGPDLDSSKTDHVDKVFFSQLITKGVGLDTVNCSYTGLGYTEIRTYRTEDFSP